LPAQSFPNAFLQNAIIIYVGHVFKLKTNRISDKWENHLRFQIIFDRFLKLLHFCPFFGFLKMGTFFPSERQMLDCNYSQFDKMVPSLTKGGTMVLKEITVIKKSQPGGSYEHITHLGNKREGWLYTQEQAIVNIQTKSEKLYVVDPNTFVPAYVTVLYENGISILRTQVEGRPTDHLLELEEST